MIRRLMQGIVMMGWAAGALGAAGAAAPEPGDPPPEKFDSAGAGGAAVITAPGAGEAWPVPETDPAQEPARALETLCAAIQARFDDPRFAHAHWGVLIESLETGRVWVERNADRLFMPASNEKIPTAAAALQALGPDFRFTTLLAATAPLTTPTLEADIVVWSNGDPTFYDRYIGESRAVFRSWARQLKARGLERVTGGVVGDDNAFDDQRIGAGWPHDGLGEWYSAEIGPLVLNENYVDFRIVPPQTPDGEVRIEPNLPSAYYKVVNNIKVVSEGRSRVSVERPFGTHEMIFTGQVAVGDSPLEESPAISNPTLWYATVLRETLIEEGIAVEGAARDVDDEPDWPHEAAALPRLAEHLSPPLSDILTQMMKRSQNLYAEILPRAMAWKETGRGSFAAGREIVARELEKLGVPPGTYRYADGSGLTRYNYISPRQIVTIYKAMLAGPNRDHWWRAQAIMGVDGTLRRRGLGTPAEGNMRGKTGTISNVRALSGTVTTADGEDLVFSFIVNAHLETSRATEDVTDDVVAWLAGFDRWPDDAPGTGPFSLDPLPR
ncbi:MAG: D-alanyl-D-alanine carboxypeptidase/D-alanyl-D-alanine-endopeptidase [Candidatus Sumerlaeia bacterium]